MTQFARETATIELPAIVATSDADYRHRLIVEQSVWVKLAARLAEDIDYPNFKTEVHGEADRDHAYYAVWSAMNSLQDKRRRGRGTQT